MEKERLILVTNDDGIEAKGLKSLIRVAKMFGRVIVAAPAEPQSGMSHAITVKIPLRALKMEENHSVDVYSCQGTPVDCVKLALNQFTDKKPDLLLSGINHGANSSTSVIYSGTMAAALEGLINGIPSIGISLLNIDPEADFSAAEEMAKRVIEKVLNEGIPENICLNVNIPDVSLDKIKGIKLCRQNKGFWKEEFDKRTDPGGKNYYWLTGEFFNSEPGIEGTDEWALKNNYVSIVPTKIDLTCYNSLDTLKDWKI